MFLQAIKFTFKTNNKYRMVLALTQSFVMHFRSSWRCFINKVALKDFIQLKKENLCRSLFYDKTPRCEACNFTKEETPTQKLIEFSRTHFLQNTYILAFMTTLENYFWLQHFAGALTANIERSFVGLIKPLCAFTNV